MHTDISTNRLISKFPKKIQQWSVLLRLDRPIGWWLLVLPSWWIILLQSISIMHSLKLILLFTIGAILMRGAGCVVNDLWDKDIDAKVERTKKANRKWRSINKRSIYGVNCNINIFVFNSIFTSFQKLYFSNNFFTIDCIISTFKKVY